MDSEHLLSTGLAMSDGTSASTRASCKALLKAVGGYAKTGQTTSKVLADMTMTELLNATANKSFWGRLFVYYAITPLLQTIEAVNELMIMRMMIHQGLSAIQRILLGYPFIVTFG